jgi:hypothetical protein
MRRVEGTQRFRTRLQRPAENYGRHLDEGDAVQELPCGLAVAWRQGARMDSTRPSYLSRRLEINASAHNDSAGRGSAISSWARATQPLK